MVLTPGRSSKELYGQYLKHTFFSLIGVLLVSAALSGCVGGAPRAASSEKASSQLASDPRRTFSLAEVTKLKGNTFANDPNRDEIFPQRVRAFEPNWAQITDSEILRLGQAACKAFKEGGDQGAAITAVHEANPHSSNLKGPRAELEGSLVLRARETLCPKKLNSPQEQYIAAIRAAGGPSKDYDELSITNGGEIYCQLLSTKSDDEIISELTAAGVQEEGLKSELDAASKYLCNAD